MASAPVFRRSDRPDEEQAIAARQGVTGLPTVVILCDGEPVGAITQAAPKRRLAAQIDAVLAA